MTNMERNQVLKMIESGKITPEEGLKLMAVLDKNPSAEGVPLGTSGSGFASQNEREPAKDFNKENAEPSSFETDARISQVRSAAQRLWQIPLWLGIGMTIICAAGMYAILQGPGLNFWFYFMVLPLLLGVAMVVAAVGSRKARWLFVNVRQKPGEKPSHIFLGFPLPLKLAAWFLRTFGSWIPDLKKTNVDDVIEILETGFSGNEPLIVHVDDDDNGERVQVYIG
jgi:hypothetical protein